MSRRDGQTIERTVLALETLLDSGVEQISVRRVLALLGVDVPQAPAEPDPKPRPDPRVDPLTGCLPVTAPGGQNASTGQEIRPRHQGGFIA